MSRLPPIFDPIRDQTPEERARTTGNAPPPGLPRYVPVVGPPPPEGSFNSSTLIWIAVGIGFLFMLTKKR